MFLVYGYFNKASMKGYIYTTGQNIKLLKLTIVDRQKILKKWRSKSIKGLLGFFLNFHDVFQFF